MTDTLINSVKAGFEAKFGYAPAGVWSAPGRVNLIGEHTDYNEGFVFPFAINRHTYAAIALREDSVVRVASSFSPAIHETDVTAIARDEAHDWAAYFARHALEITTARLRRYGELSRGAERSSPRQFFPDYIIAMCGYDFREGQAA